MIISVVIYNSGAPEHSEGISLFREAEEYRFAARRNIAPERSEGISLFRKAEEYRFAARRNIAPERSEGISLKPAILIPVGISDIAAFRRSDIAAFCRSDMSGIAGRYC